MISTAIRSTFQDRAEEPASVFRLRAIRNEQQADAEGGELLRLRDRHRSLLIERKPLKAERERLWEVASAEWKALGLSIDDNIAQWEAHMERTGYTEAEDVDSKVLDAIMETEKAIRAIPAASFSGLSVKLAVLRNNLSSRFDDHDPREDQDWDALLFNEFADEVDRLAACVPAKRAAQDPMLDAINAYRAAVAAFKAIPAEQVTIENEDALVEATYGPAQEVIMANEPYTPKVTSLEGVREAIRLTFEENALIDCIAINALRSALAYLDQEAV